MEELRFVNFINGNFWLSDEIMKSERMSSNGGNLGGLTKTMAVIISGKNGYNKKSACKDLSIDNVYFSTSNQAVDILEIMKIYQPEYFHLLGWPEETADILTGCQGVLGGMGFFGTDVFGEKAISMHINFCRETGKKFPFPIYCKRINLANKDNEDIIYWDEFDIHIESSPLKEYARLMPHLASVQIEGRRRLCMGNYVYKKLPLPIKELTEMALLKKVD